MPIINHNEVFTIWVKNPPSHLVLRCWNSWIENGYTVSVYVDDSFGKDWKLPDKMNGKVLVKHLRCLGIESLLKDEDKLLHKIDLWRFIILNKYGGTWLDSDLYLISRLPHNKIIISSEHTLKKGAYKSSDNKKPNIGCLRFTPNHPFTKAVVEKMKDTTKEDINDNVNQTSKMLKFCKMLKTKKWKDMNRFIVEPQVFCPIPWTFAKEIYMNDKDSEFKTKYGLEYDYTDETTCGIHLWNNIRSNKYKIDLDKCNENSLWNMIN
tara:strand:- start:10265 stop:11059 length:795 start_codon:yes stop_codon:yes gene_type:complete